jgi:hypothetical protein
MKKIFSTITGLSLIIALGTGCSKSVHDRTASLAPLSTDNNDLNAGSWRPVLLSRPDTFAVAAPAAISSPSYQADLNEIKALQQHPGKDQDGAIKYWAAGSVLRWNEIMRDLVAKYNLPAVQKDDGTYPAPSSANPLAYPQFPFANPPYAARAYAYVSAAQYDALIACWYYKTKYNQAAPYKNDSSVAARFINKTDLPAYPSEAAVLAGATAEMMKLLFPGEIANINQKAAEAEEAAIASGAATRAAVTAGDALGRQVAQAFITRARGDHAGTAGGSKTDWTNFETVTQSLGQIPWYSLETPKRPPMLPLFYKVLPFLFDSASIPSFRPGPPPSTSSKEFQQDADEVYNFIKNPSRENIGIVQYWADGVGTYTPPGHWDAIGAEDFVKKNWSEVRMARNMALLNMAEMDVAIVCWDIKYYYFNPRPTQINPSIKTLTGIPNFPSYVSGHSCFSGAAATVLSYLIPENASKYEAMAEEAGMSRLMGGIHYRVDCETGLQVGKNVGQYAVQRAMTDGGN